MYMDSLLKKYRPLFTLILLLTIGVLCMMLPAWISGQSFVGGGDIKTQWDPFYVLSRRETIDALRQGKLPFYSWILFLGTNLWASKASYGLFDLFNVLTYPLSVSYLYIYEFLCFVKIICAGVFFYLYLDEFKLEKRHCILGGLIYGLSSFSIYYTSEFGFLSFYALLPLYLLGIESYLKRQRKILFIISVVLLFLTNYYLFFAVSAYTVVYFLYRYYNIHGTLKGFFKEALILIGYYFIGFLISGAFILPVVFFILQNSRVGSGGYGLTYAEFKTYLHLLIAPFVPNQTYIFGNDIFDDYHHNIKEICLYSAACVSVLVPQFIRNKDKKYVRSTLIVYILFALFLFCPPLSAILNGFAEPSFRWTMVFIAFSILTAMKALEAEKDERLLKRTMIIESALVIFISAVSVIATGSSFKDYLVQFSEFLIAIAFSILVYHLIHRGREKTLIVVTLCELCLFASLFGYRVKGVEKENYFAARNVIGESSNKDSLKDYLNSLEEGNYSSFYRVYVPYESLYWSASRNMNIYYNIPGVMTYDSTYEPSFNEMKYIGNIPTVKEIDWEFSVEDPDLLDFLSVRYAIVLSEEEIPFRNYEILTRDYRGFLMIAKNSDEKKIGQTVTKVMGTEDWNKDPAALKDTLITDRPEEYRNYIQNKEMSEVYDVEVTGNSLCASIDSKGESVAVFSIPYDKGWKILVNGAEVDYDKVNAGFIGVKIPDGYSRIEMCFVPQGFKYGAVMSAIGALSFLVLIVFDLRRRRKNI